MGIAIKLSTKDFSSENLGTVTFAVDYETTAMNKATAYCTAIGDTTYKTQLYQFFLELMYEGLWPKIYGLYPMLGDNLTKLSLNAKDVTTNSLITFANASAGDKCLSFVKTIGIGENDIASIDLFPFSNYLILQRTTSTSANSRLLCYHNISPSDAVGTLKLGTRVSGKAMFFYINYSPQVDFSNNSLNKQRLGFCATNNNMQGLENGTILESVPSKHINTVRPNLAIGAGSFNVYTSGETINENNSLFSGNVYFYYIGTMNMEELSTFDGITADFMSSVKNISV